MDLSFYRGKTVLITGHTGFKGTWLTRVLLEAGAQVVGYALKAESDFFEVSQNEAEMVSIIGDVCDLKHLMEVFKTHQPEIVFHLAAQPLVRLSYEKPVETYQTNVMGTVNIMECIRLNPCVKSFVNVTTDKVYLNTEQEYAYTEEDRLDGFDPYSNSKSCSELVTASYHRSFDFKHCAVSTARSGNVIGGGDFAKDRIIPDCAKALSLNEKIVVRNPKSTRPYQHVLETLRGYLLIAMKQVEDRSLEGSYNIGPDDSDNLQTENLVQLFCKHWGQEAQYVIKEEKSVHEAKLLQLNHSKITNTLGWKPIWGAEDAVIKSVEWYKSYYSHQDMKALTLAQIQEYFK